MHTPGPWRVEFRLNKLWVRAGQADIVAIALPNEPESPENAHLIAAAPELLAALEQVKEAFAKLADIAGDVPEWNRGGFAYTASKAVKAAIAKAKGETL